MHAQRISLVAALAALCLLTGCSGPDYAGGPTDEAPHGLVRAGSDVTIWRVDGFTTESRSGTLKVAPGQRRFKIRVEHPMESDSATPFDYRNMTLYIEENKIYMLSRKDGDYPPYEVEVTQGRLN